MKKSLISLLVLSICLPVSLHAIPEKAKREYYKIVVYHFKTNEQKLAIDNYLQNAWLPALHRMGITKIGVFTPIANDTVIDKRIFIVAPVKSLEVAIDIPNKLAKDESYQQAAKDYLEAVYNNPPFTRMENILTLAFPDAPQLELPQLKSEKSEHIYEYRSYESPTEKLFRNKVQMFNEGGEIPLFKRLNFNGIFYSEVIAGSNMPNLIYMTSFENIADRDAHWKTFGADPEWKKLSSDPIYQHNVSKVESTLMKATSYSDY